MAVSSEEVNYLVYRYLQESGFTHASFAFGHESHILKNDYKNIKLPPGALINLLQKGLLYTEVEAHINDDGTERECARSFSLLDFHECDNGNTGHVAKKSTSRKNSLAGKKHKRDKEQTTITSTNNASVTISQRQPSSSTTSRYVKKAKKDEEEDEDKMDIDNAAHAFRRKHEIQQEQTCTLSGHNDHVFVCQWHPTRSLLVSGSKDGAAKLWHVPELPYDGQVVSDAIELKYTPGDPVKRRDITTIEWNVKGDTFATGGYDGVVRLWSDEGVLQHTLAGHQGPIFSLKWNRTSQYLLSAGADGHTVIWDPTKGELKQRFNVHSESVLDIDWKSDTVFASCGTDRTINICRLGEDQPLKRFFGHTADVNCIRWCPRGHLLASGSDDKTVKIWTMDNDKCLFDMKGHDSEIYTLKWSPTGPGTQFPNQRQFLAAASFNGSVRIWDPTTGRPIHTLDKHTGGVYGIAFSPDGRFLASGSLDQNVYVWSVKDGSIVKSFSGFEGGIFDLGFDKSGERLVAGSSDNTIRVLDVR